MDSDFKKYIKGLLDQKVDPKVIKNNLMSSGWNESQIDRAIAELQNAGTADALQAPLPASMIEIFGGFGTFFLIWTVALSLGTLFFQLINKAFPDPLVDKTSYYYFFTNPSGNYLINSSIASLIVAFPFLIWAVIFIFRRFGNQLKKESRLNKWLSYIIIYSAWAVATTDLTSLVTSYLEGELTMRTFLKIFVVLVIALLVIAYFYFERKKIEYKKEVSPGIFIGLGSLVAMLIIAGTVWGLIVSGGQGSERKKKFDLMRAQNLSSLDSAIQGYGNKNGQLPESLEDLRDDTTYSYYYKNAKDPETNELFEYKILSDGKTGGMAKYRLCADFALAASQDSESPSYYYDYSYQSASWSEHEAGRVCKEKQVQLYNYNIYNPPNNSPNRPGTIIN
ncbi:hypothetical protein HYT00_02270 [Candidatus Giovannonibacteria bacterium]|nr:hypothetical protein [Candidatus Giovannonibacteria bacterium]